MPTLYRVGTFFALCGLDSKAKCVPTGSDERETVSLTQQKQNMNKKHVIGAVLVGMALGYVLQNYIAKVPVINKLPRLGGSAA